MINPARDAEIVRLRATGLSLRKIARQCNTSLGYVQRALRRAEDRSLSVNNPLAQLRAKRAEYLRQLTTEGNPR